MFAQAEIEGARVRDVIRAPRTSHRGASLVYVVDNWGRLRFREETPLPVRRDLVLSQEGLEEGDLTCQSPLEAVLNAMSVRSADSGDSPGS